MMQTTTQNYNRVVRIGELGKLIQEKRRSERLTLAAAAQQSRVSAPTLSRLERQSTDGGKVMTPDTHTLTALTQWLGVTVEQMVTMDQPQDAPMYTPEIVKAHLRADRNLNPDAAEALGEMFRLAYDQFSRTSSLSAERTADKPENPN